MKVCYFGIYRPEYSRNKILISGLRFNGVSVVECKTDKRGIVKYLDLIKKHWQIRKKYDIMIVGFPGFQSAILAKLLTKKPIVFDAFLSMYDSIVLDRKQVVSKSLRAKYLWWLDKISMSVADVVLFDTNEHIKYVTKEFNLPKEKFERIFIGADTDIFFPVDDNGKDDDKFKVLFYGTFIPLQGVEYIIKAAKELENEKDILFIMIGNGQEKKKALSIAKELNVNNISFLDSYSQPRLSDEIAKADVCLGIFGDTEKARRVIPNKVFECVAMKRTVITADTLAARELFKDNEVVFVKISDSKAIAEAILKLKKDKTMAKIIAENGYKKFLSETTIKKLGYQLLNMIKRYEQ